RGRDAADVDRAAERQGARAGRHVGAERHAGEELQGVDRRGRAVGQRLVVAVQVELAGGGDLDEDVAIDLVDGQELHDVGVGAAGVVAHDEGPGGDGVRAGGLVQLER